MSAQKRVAAGKGAAAGPEREGKDVSGESRRGGLCSRLIRGKTSTGTRAGAARYLQRSSRTLPGISTRLVSMMRTHRRSSASRLRAAGDQGYGTETPARRRAGGGSNEDEQGKGRDPRTSVPHPQPWTPRGWAEARGGAPGLNAPVLLEQPNGKLENREPEHAGPIRRLLIGPSSPIRLQGAQLLLRKPTSRRL